MSGYFYDQKKLGHAKSYSEISKTDKLKIYALIRDIKANGSGYVYNRHYVKWIESNIKHVSISYEHDVKLYRIDFNG